MYGLRNSENSNVTSGCARDRVTVSCTRAVLMNVGSYKYRQLHYHIRTFITETWSYQHGPLTALSNRRNGILKSFDC